MRLLNLKSNLTSRFYKVIRDLRPKLCNKNGREVTPKNTNSFHFNADFWISLGITEIMLGNC